MRPISSFTIAAIFTCLSFAVQAEDTTYTIAKSVPFAEDSTASTDVKADCTLDTRLPEFIKAAAKSGVKVVISDEPLDDLDGKVLHLTISHVLGTGGGAWSGSKSVTVKGELFENGKVIGSFTAARFSSGGAFGGFKGTCAILGRCIKSIGKDIAGWLKKPTMGAMLGNA